MSKSSLQQFLNEDKLRNTTNENLADLAFEIECQCMDPRSKHYNTWQSVVEVVIKKYDGLWENWVHDNPDDLKQILIKYM